MAMPRPLFSHSKKNKMINKIKNILAKFLLAPVAGMLVTWVQGIAFVYGAIAMFLIAMNSIAFVEANGIALWLIYGWFMSLKWLLWIFYI